MHSNVPYYILEEGHTSQTPEEMESIQTEITAASVCHNKPETPSSNSQILASSQVLTVSPKLEEECESLSATKLVPTNQNGTEETFQKNSPLNENLPAVKSEVGDFDSFHAFRCIVINQSFGLKDEEEKMDLEKRITQIVSKVTSRSLSLQHSQRKHQRQWSHTRSHADNEDHVMDDEELHSLLGV